MAAAKKKKGTRKSTIRKRKTQNAKRDNLIRMARRVVILTVIIVVTGWAMAWFILSDSHTTSSNWIKDKTLAITADAGFKVEEILVDGRHNTNPDLLLALINVKEGDPIFLFSPKDAKEKIQEITWIESVHIERRLPHTIYIKLHERTPFALWHNDGKLVVIDVNGSILTNQNVEPFKDLMMIRGAGAQAKAHEFLNILSGEKILLSMIDHAELIDERRWDLLLKDGKRIKLPEDDIGLAMRHLMRRHAQEDILGKESITDIDARYQGRLIVRTKLGTVQDYKAQVDIVGTPL
ncbi:MAG: cell division protein FtsQ/DivIB [Alphaproteobacteria bacterium]